jgi:hypothetical protein
MAGGDEITTMYEIRIILTAKVDTIWISMVIRSMMVIEQAIFHGSSVKEGDQDVENIRKSKGVLST